MKRPSRYAIATVVVLLSGLAIWMTRWVPRYQLTGRSVGYLSSVIQRFIQEHGRMPYGLDELRQVELLSRSSDGEWLVNMRGLGFEAGRWPIHYVEDLFVDWSVRAETLTESGDLLFDGRTGRKAYIVGADSWVYGGGYSYYSILIYRALVDAQNRASNASERDVSSQEVGIDTNGSEEPD